MSHLIWEGTPTGGCRLSRKLASLADLSCYGPAINTTYFPNTVSSNYWTSTTNTYGTSYAWYVHFYNGNDRYDDKNNDHYVRAVRGGQSGAFGNFIISQSPQSGAPGTTFTQSGIGFTPNSTATLHFWKPDGNEYPTQQQAVDAWGQFSLSYTAPLDKPPGTYAWCAVDGPTGRTSNYLSYTIASDQAITTGNYNVTNSRTVSNCFELWLDISIDNQKPGSGFMTDYRIEIRDATLPTGVSIETKDCYYRGDGRTPNSSRYRQFFKIEANTDDAAPAWFENGWVYIVNKSSGVAHKIDDLKDFCVFGTQFDVTKHAWKFANGSWEFALKSPLIWKAADYIASNYLKKAGKKDFWKSIGRAIPWAFSTGLCYGLANVAIANFNHTGDDVWGTGNILEWGKRFRTIGIRKTMQPNLHSSQL